MNRKNLLLTALLAIQAILAVFAVMAMHPGKKEDAKEIAFFPGIKAEDIQELVIAEKEDKLLTLVKAGSAWTISGADGVPAQTAKVEATVSKLVGLKSSRLVTQTASSHSRLRVADHNYLRQIKLKTKDGKEESILFGSSPSTMLTHARLSGQKEVYLARDISIWDIQTSPDSWWETKIVDTPDDEIQEVKLTNNAGSFTLTRGEDKQWKAEGVDFSLDQNEVGNFLERITGLKIAKYEGKEEKPEFGLKTPAATLVVKGKDKTWTVFFGPKDAGKNDHAAKSDGSPFYVRVAAIETEPLLARKAEDFRPGATPKPATENGEGAAVNKADMNDDGISVSMPEGAETANGPDVTDEENPDTAPPPPVPEPVPEEGK